jgi:hypothetical protein
VKRWGDIALDAARANPDVTVITPVTAMPADAARWLAAHPHGASEHEEQVALFEWAEMAQGEHPELAMLFAIPNGGQRHPAVAAQLKVEGVKAGIPDLFLAVARGRWHGLFIELKVKPNKATEAQHAWIDSLRYYGYSAVICFGAQDAINVIKAYLSQYEGAV